MLLFLLLPTILQAMTYLQTVTITASSQTFTLTFPQSFSKVPAFAYFIQSGNIQSSEFAVTHVPGSTVASETQLVIAFQLHKSPILAGQYLTLSLLTTDENGLKVNFGVVELDISASTLTFSGFDANYVNSKLEVYPLSLPMNFTKYTTTSNTVTLIFIATPPTYFVQGSVFFSYIYLTNAYSAQHPVSLFQDINQEFYGYVLSYSPFAFLPSTSSTLLAVRTYTSTAGPFFPLTTHSYFTPSGGSVDNFLIGYTDDTTKPIIYNADVLLLNSSFEGCDTQQFLYYIDYFSSLPLSCSSCTYPCKTCLIPNLNQPSVTNSDSCQSCSYPRYFVSSDSISGSCECYPGVEEVGGECSQCDWKCLTFQVVFIESTSETYFLIYYSYQNVLEQIPIEQNLLIFLNGRSIPFTCTQHSQAVYVAASQLQEFNQCEGSTCQVQFLFQHPEAVLLEDLSRSLSNNNRSILLQNFVNYQTILPASVQEAFSVLSMIVAGSFGSGYTSLLKILFQLQQLIDAHKYLNLNLPVIFNQLVQSLQNFKFMDFSNLLPKDVVDGIRNVAPNYLEQMGPPKLIYYDQGVNFVKNIIMGIISVIVMLIFNFIIYLLLRLIPFKITRKFAKKISKRKMITVHDILEQLQLPVFIYAMAQLHHVILLPSLSWVYGATMTLATAALLAPFGVIIYIWSQRHKQENTDVYEDLMQDNDMKKPVTFVYYVFNYFRKIFFALCLTFTLPGLIQIYLLITLNTVHLAFQLYLVVSKVYLSKSKVLIRLVNSISVIAVEVLILIYNLDSYSNQTNINIGMTCFYLSITTAILGLIDAFIKLLDTIFQEVSNKKKVNPEPDKYPKQPLLPEFRKNIQCKIGQDLVPPQSKPKPSKFQIDKELIENTFPGKEPQIKSEDSCQVSEAEGRKTHHGELDLVYIDDDWTDVYPMPEPDHIHHLHSHNSATKIHKNKDSRPSNQESNAQLYEIPVQIDRQARMMVSLRRQRQRVRGSQRKPEEEYVQVPGVSTKRAERGRDNRLQVRPIRESNSEQLSEFDPNNP